MNVAVLSFFFLIPLFLLATSFTRIFIVLSFLKKSLGDLGIPSGQILFGLALLFSLLVMREPMTAIYQDSLLPFLDSKMPASEFLKKSEIPLRSFMTTQVTETDLKFVRTYSKVKNEEKETPFMLLLGAFTLSELKKGLFMGLLLWVPFLLIDFLTSSFISALGIQSFHSAMIALPLKLLLFLAIDGWHLLFGTIAESYWVR